MSWDAFKGNWKQHKGNQREPLPVGADALLDIFAGEHDALSSQIQEAYGITKEEAESQVNAF